MRFSNLKIGARLALCFSAITLITVLLGVLSGIQLQHVFRNSEAVSTNWLPSIKVLGELRVAINRARTVEAELLLTNNSELKAKKRLELQERTSSINEIERTYVALITDGEERRLHDEFRALRANYLQIQSNILNLPDTSETQHAQISALFSGSFQDAFKAMIEKIGEISVLNNRGAIQAYQEAQQSFAQSKVVLISAVIMAIVLASGLAFWITKLITQPLHRAVQAVESIASGDLSIAIASSSTDETGQLLRGLESMRNRLAATVGEVRGNAVGVASASTQIAQGNNDLSARTEQQASALEQTAASMEELNSTVRQNADNAQQASKLASDASSVAIQGGKVVGEVVETMKNINESSRRIADIIGTIDGIAFQTNILALNAAVEAARAGEQGRGFAVVASEVRNLAQRSAEAAKEIKDLIGDSVERVEQGTALVDKAGTTMTEVVNSIQRVTDVVAEISAASREQSLGVSQVGQAVSQMDQVTQQNAALVEESAAAAESLKGQAEQLVQAVAFFQMAGELQAPISGTTSAKNFQPMKFLDPLLQSRTANSSISKPKSNAPKPLTRSQKSTAVATSNAEEEWESF